MNSKVKKNIKIVSPRLLLIVSLISIIFIAISIYYEYRARQNDYLILLNKQATLFINTLSNSSQNAIIVAENIENETNNRILANLKIIEIMDQNIGLSQEQLDKLLPISRLEALLVYNVQGKLILKAIQDSSSTYSIPFPVLQHRLNKTLNDTILTLYDDRRLEIDQLVAFVRRERGGLIAAFIDQEDIRSLRRMLGIGYFLRRFQSDETIEYIVIQTPETIVAGSFNNYTISTFSKDPLLQKVLDNNKIESRIINYDKQLVFETISPFHLDERPFGVLRLGLSMQEYEHLRKDAYKRLYIFAAVLVVFGLIFVNFVISYHHRKLLHRDLERLQEYTNTILENLVSGVISINHEGRVQSINKHALLILNVEYQNVIFQPFTVLPSPLRSHIELCLDSNKKLSSIVRHWITSNEGHKRFIAIRTNILEDEKNNKTYVLLIDDITDQTRLELQINRNQRLDAMQKLASAVAHEIKNPLNAISLIVDLIRKKYKPLENEETYSRNLDTVREEINRISGIVEQYLRFARPPHLTFTTIHFPELISEIASLFGSHLKEKNITFRHDIQSHHPIKGDMDQLKQVFINLIKNAEEAIEPPGEISIIGKEANNNYEITVSDSGKGIPKKNINSIFDLHFTTKKGGSGIGLSVVQQIITAHNGRIDVESEEGNGTSILLKFPLVESNNIVI